jgi:hypothetical protein
MFHLSRSGQVEKIALLRHSERKQRGQTKQMAFPLAIVHSISYAAFRLRNAGAS